MGAKRSIILLIEAGERVEFFKCSTGAWGSVSIVHPSTFIWLLAGRKLHLMKYRCRGWLSSTAVVTSGRSLSGSSINSFLVSIRPRRSARLPEQVGLFRAPANTEITGCFNTAHLYQSNPYPQSMVLAKWIGETGVLLTVSNSSH